MRRRHIILADCILVRMTRMRTRARPAPSGRWALQDAKARFSEVVRKAQVEGPQRITVHGREEVVVVASDEFRRLTEQRTGQALVDAFRDSPAGELVIEHEPTRAPVRDLDRGL